MPSTLPTIKGHSGKLLLHFIIASMISSCVSYKELLILNEGDTLDGDSLTINPPGTFIQTDDRLLIRVSAFNPKTAAPFNQNMTIGGGTGQGGGGVGQLNNNSQEAGNSLTEAMISNLVDTNGNIEFPVLGTINLKGLTLEAAKIKMYGLLDPYLTNYSVDIQILNRRLTVSGEVNEPGVVELERNKITTLEAIERAEGFTGF